MYMHEYEALISGITATMEFGIAKTFIGAKSNIAADTAEIVKLTIDSSYDKLAPRETTIEQVGWALRAAFDKVEEAEEEIKSGIDLIKIEQSVIDAVADILKEKKESA